MVGEIIGLNWDNWVKLNFELEGQMDACWKALEKVGPVAEGFEPIS